MSPASNNRRVRAASVRSSPANPRQWPVVSGLRDLARGLLILAPMKMKNPRALLTAGLGGVAATALDVGVLVLLVAHQVAIPLAAFIAALYLRPS